MSKRVDKMAEMARQGATLKEISRKFSVTRKFVRDALAPKEITFPEDETATPRRNPRLAFGKDPLPSGHPFAMSLLPRLNSLEGLSQ